MKRSFLLATVFACSALFLPFEIQAKKVSKLVPAAKAAGKVVTKVVKAGSAYGKAKAISNAYNDAATGNSREAKEYRRGHKDGYEAGVNEGRVQAKTDFWARLPYGPRPPGLVMRAGWYANGFMDGHFSGYFDGYRQGYSP